MKKCFVTHSVTLKCINLIIRHECVGSEIDYKNKFLVVFLYSRDQSGFGFVLARLEIILLQRILVA